MKIISILCSIFLFTTPVFAAPLSSNAANNGLIIVGTLADSNNPVEMALAPEYTRVILVRQGTTRLLTRLSLLPNADVDTLKTAVFAANNVQQIADEVRVKLDVLSKMKDGAEFRFALDDVRSLIKRAEAIYARISREN